MELSIKGLVLNTQNDFDLKRSSSHLFVQSLHISSNVPAASVCGYAFMVRGHVYVNASIDLAQGVGTLLLRRYVEWASIGRVGEETQRSSNVQTITGDGWEGSDRELGPSYGTIKNKQPSSSERERKKRLPINPPPLPHETRRQPGVNTGNHTMEGESERPNT